MIFYAHTAEDDAGKRLPESCGKWQLLSDHLSNVAERASRFAIPLGLWASGWKPDLRGCCTIWASMPNDFRAG